MRMGLYGRQLRIEKVVYSGKEGKTSQGCPLAKWILRRVDKEEKILCIVKRRQGHKYVLHTHTKYSFLLIQSNGHKKKWKLILLFLVSIIRCRAAYIIVCLVAWDGLPKYDADNAYKLLVHKLNKFGLPTTRRCATNENRTCACQGKTDANTNLFANAVTRAM